MDEKLDINRADVNALASLPGIGVSRAKKIVAYRTQTHPFEEIIELAAVPGISEQMVGKIAELITVNGTAEEDPAFAVEEIVLPVEEMELEAAESDNGSGSNGEEDAAGLPVEQAAEAEEVGGTAEDEAEIVVETAEEDRPVMGMMLDERQSDSAAEPEPEPTPQPTPVPERPRPEIVERRVVETVQRRHFHFWQQLAGVMAGAVIGAGLTLMLLFLFNGTLRFAEEKQVSNLQVELDEQTSSIRQSQSSMVDEMGEVTGRLAELDNGLAVSEGAIEAVAEDVTGLEEETAALNEQLETINLSAEKFDNFLSGLRDLLITLQGLPPAPTSTTTISGTATITTTITPEGTAEPPSFTPTPTAAATEGPGPTRTPRPTATPLIE
jgi:competence ComEA-like helix-hairpin-helix protein